MLIPLAEPLEDDIGRRRARRSAASLRLGPRRRLRSPPPAPARSDPLARRSAALVRSRSVSAIASCRSSADHRLDELKRPETASASEPGPSVRTAAPPGCRACRRGARRPWPPSREGRLVATSPRPRVRILSRVARPAISATTSIPGRRVAFVNLAARHRSAGRAGSGHVGHATPVVASIAAP